MSKLKINDELKLQQIKKKEQNNNNDNNNLENNIENYYDINLLSKIEKKLPNNYYININQDGLKTIDKVNHLNLNLLNKSFEYKLRPISGLCNYIKRNNINNYDLINETDFIKRICNINTLRRLDLSFNNLNNYPLKLCNLILIESLNLRGNKLNDLPNDFEKYQNLNELIIDLNEFKKIPKSIFKCKKLTRLNISNNLLNDLKYIENLKKLKYLIIEKNLIINIDNNLKELDKLEIIDLNNNLITNLSNNLFLSLNSLKQLNLSFNKLTNILPEIFMLPNIEIINLSNNNLNILPIIPIDYYRTIKIYSIDLSFNKLIKFYDYLLNICININLNNNNIKKIQNKIIKKLNKKIINEIKLYIYNNPINEPPYDICINGLNSLRYYFDIKSNNEQINKGFKILMFGDNNSGKTCLSYALDDYYSKSDLIEQYLLNNNNNNINNESKFINIHELKFYNNEQENNSDLISFMPVNIYEFNGNLNQYNYLINYFLDNSGLIIICIDCTPFIPINNNIDLNKSINYIKKIIDLIILKQNKNNFYYIIPVITKCDKINKINYNIDNNDTKFNKLNEINNIYLKIKNIINLHLNNKKNDIKNEINNIEKLSIITTSQTDRLKQFMQIENCILPEIHNQCLYISSIKMFGINKLIETIKNIVYTKNKYFNQINNKLPTFWSDVETFTITKLSKMSIIKLNQNNYELIIKDIIRNDGMSFICIDYDDFKKKIIEKYGMKHLIDQILNYFNSIGSFIWFKNNNKLSNKIFTRPKIIFDLLFVLYRDNFNDNFNNNNYSNEIFNKIIKLNNNNKNNLVNNLINYGELDIELLKIIWFPILITDSILLIQEIFIIFSIFFNIGYPKITKEKLKQIYNSFNNNNNNNNKYQSNSFNSIKSIDNNNNNNKIINFNKMIFPFYLPSYKNKNELNEIKLKLISECSIAKQFAIESKLKKDNYHLKSIISQKYSFKWDLINGIFDIFSTKCLINSDLYYKIHLKNLILAYNEENSIG